MTYTATIRQRGQLTIPDQVRGMLGWLQTGAVVGIEADKDEVRIKPKIVSKKQTDWDKIWRTIKLTRSLKARGKISPPLSLLLRIDSDINEKTENCFRFFCDCEVSFCYGGKIICLRRIRCWQMWRMKKSCS